MKRMMKLLSIVAVLALTANLLTSCADTSYIATVGGTKIDSVDYAFMAQYMMLSLENQYTDVEKLNEYLDKVDTTSNSTEKRKNSEILNESIKNYFEVKYISKMKFKELNLTDDDELKTELETQFNNFKTGIGGQNVVNNCIKNLNIDEAVFKQLFFDYVLSKNDNAIINYYFGDNGEKKISDDDFYNVFVNVKHILIDAPYISYDSKTGLAKEFTEEQKQQDADAKAKADSLKAEIEAGTKDYITLMNDTTINTDTSVADHQDGYILKRATAEEREQGRAMVQEFEDAAFDMKVGEIRVVRTKYGYHIMRKDDLRPLIPKYKAKYLPQMPQVITDYAAMNKEWKDSTAFSYNNAALKKFDIKNIKLVKLSTTSSKASSNKTISTTFSITTASKK